jgi:hypothetical protein
MRPCVSFLHCVLLFLVPLPVSPRPLRNAHDHDHDDNRSGGHGSSMGVVAKRVMAPVVSNRAIQAASYAQPPYGADPSAELPADQSSDPNSENLPNVYQQAARSPQTTYAGVAITTFSDGLVLSEFSGVASDPPLSILSATTTQQIIPTSQQQDPSQQQDQVVQDSSKYQTSTAPPQPSNGNNLGIVTTLSSSRGYSSLAPAFSQATLSTVSAVPTAPPSG